MTLTTGGTMDVGKAIAIIPARGGSKRIPRKNVRVFCGEPIMAYPIRAALSSNCFDEVIVSTDDEEIASLARSYGANVPFLRSAETASDTASTASVLEEVLERRRAEGRGPDPSLACCIYPTAVFATPEILRAARSSLLADPAVTSVLAVTPFPHPIERALKRTDGRMAMIQREYQTMRTQDLAPSYYDAGQFYWFRVSAFAKDRDLISGAVGYLIESAYVQGIDNEGDWNIAEMKFARLPSRA